MSDPFTNLNFEELFASFFGAGGIGRRVLGLEVHRGYRDLPEERRPIVFRRRVVCETCGAEGCKACSLVGWKIVREALTVTIPAGSQAGTTLRIPEKGDSYSAQKPGDVYLEIAEPGERADELRRAQIEYETKLASSWEEAKNKKDTERKKALRGLARALGLAMLISTVLGGLWLRQYLDRARTGERCATDGDCRSSQCLVLTRPEGSFHFFAQETGRVCTADCETDADCPAQMSCGGVGHSYFQTLTPTHADKLACVPRSTASGTSTSTAFPNH